MQHQHSRILKVIDPFLAVRDGSARDLVKCIDNGLDVNVCKCASGWGLLHRVKHDIPSNNLFSSRRTLIKSWPQAAEQGQTDICQILLDAGAKVNARTSCN